MKGLLARTGGVSWMCAAFLAARFSSPVLAQSQAEPRSSVSISQEASIEVPAVTVEDLVREALEHNPGIEAARRAVEARRAMILPARTLPEPMLTFQTMGNLIPPTLQRGDPSSARTLSVEQEIPYPGKLSLRGKVVEAEAEVESWSYEERRRELTAQVKAAYYDLYLVHKSIETLRKDQDLLQTFAQIAEAKYRVGQGLQQDVLKAQVEISKLIDRMAVLEERRGIAEALLNGLLYRPAGTPLGPLAEVEKAELRYSFEELYELAQANYPALNMQAREIDRNQYAVQLAHKEFYPDFAVGFTYFNRTEMPEMYGLMFGAKLPLYYRRKQRPELEGATEALLSSERQRDNIVSLLSFKVKDAYLVATTSGRLLDLYAKTVVPQATLSLESAVAGYQVGGVDFLTLIDNLVTLLDYELRYYEVLTDYQKALAQMEPLVGLHLTS